VGVENNKSLEKANWTKRGSREYNERRKNRD